MGDDLGMRGGVRGMGGLGTLGEEGGKDGKSLRVEVEVMVEFVEEFSVGNGVVSFGEVEEYIYIYILEET